MSLEQLEEITSVEQDQIRKFYYLAYHVFAIQQNIKCSICFEIFEHPVALSNCTHIFCDDCIKSHLEYSTVKEPPCPVCQRPIPRNCLRPYGSLTASIKFVRDALGQINKIVNLDCKEFPSFQKIEKVIKQNKNSKVLLGVPNDLPAKPVTPPDYSVLLKGRKIIVGLNNEEFINEELLLQETNDDLDTSKKSTGATKDPFDILKESPVVNPLFKPNNLLLNTKTYNIQKRITRNRNQTNTKYVDKIYEFKDNANKINTIRWLQDSRNKFDLIPCSQESSTVVQTQSSEFDMPSVSQRFPYKVTNAPLLTQINRQKIEQNRIRQKNQTVIRLSRSDFAKNRCVVKNNPRGRSLDYNIRTVEPRPKLKRHSITICESVDENIIIEQINSEEEALLTSVLNNPKEKVAIVGLMEEEYLKTIDNEMLQNINKPSTSGKSTKKVSPLLDCVKKSERIALKDTQKKTSSKKVKSNLETSSGWTRMKEIKKTIRKTEKKTSKLTVVSRNSSIDTGDAGSFLTSKVKSKKKPTKNKEPVVIIEKLDENYSINRGINTPVPIKSHESRPPTFDLDAMESYFSKNLKNVKVSPCESQVTNNNKKLKDSNQTKLKENSTSESNLSKNHSNNDKNNTSVKIKNKSPPQVLKENNLPRIQLTNNAGKTETIKIENQSKSNNENNIKRKKKISSPSTTTNEDVISIQNDVKHAEIKNDVGSTPDNEGIVGLQNDNITKTRRLLRVDFDKTKKEVPKEQLKNERVIRLKQNKSPLLTKDVKKALKTEIKPENKISQNTKTKTKLSTSTEAENKDLDKRNILPNSIDLEKDKLSVSSLLASEVEMEISELNEDKLKDTMLVSPVKSNIQQEIPLLEDVEQTNSYNKLMKPQDETGSNSRNVLSLKLKSEGIMDSVANNIEENLWQLENGNFNDINEDDAVFAKPTQGVNPKNLSHEWNYAEDNDDIFEIPTQIINTSDNTSMNAVSDDKELKTLLKEKLKTLNGILNAFEGNSEFPCAKKQIPKAKHMIANTTASIRNVLQDIKNFMNISESVDENTIGKRSLESTNDLPNLSREVTRTVHVQTDNSNDVSSLFSHSVTTQTNFPKNLEKHVAIQTDSLNSSRGFRISSTEMFNPRPVTEAHVQTDALVCPKCCYTFHGNEDRIDLDTLRKDKQIIKSLSEKYSLSGSFDNIKFETQDIIKGRHIESITSENLKSTEGSVSAVDKNYSIHPKGSDTLDKSQQVCTANVMPQNHSKTETKKSFKRIRKPSSDSDSDNDLILKDIKRNKYMPDNLSIHFISGTSQEKSSNNKQSQDGFQLSEGSQGINYKEYLEKVLKKCDKDSPMKETIPPKVNFEKPAEPPAKRFKTQDIIKECEMIIKEACSHTLRIENTEGYTNNLNSSRGQNVAGPSKLTLSALEEEFQHNFNNSVEGDKNKNIDANAVKTLTSNKRFEDSNAELNINDDILNKSKNVKDKFSESLFNSGDDLKNINLNKSTFAKQDNTEKTTKQCLDELINQFNELDDSFEDDVNAEVQSINESVLESKNCSPNDNINSKSSKIKILQNITVKDGSHIIASEVNNRSEIKGIFKKAHEPEDLDTSIDGNTSTKSDEMFESDEDIVETTPQKNKPALDKLSFLSQAYYNPEEKMVLPPLAGETPNTLDAPPLSCLNQTFTPPPEFQDFFKNDVVENDKDNELIIIGSERNEVGGANTEVTKNAPALSSLTPDLLLPPNIQVNMQPTKKEVFVTSTPFTQSSQIISARSLNLSPIHSKEQNPKLNPILAAQHSKFSPLTIVKSKTPPPQRMVPLNTSTPKQKSILNYVRPTENLNTSLDQFIQPSQRSVQELSQANKKPCVACTRMSKEQLLAITILSNKKLISYSSSFSSGVTHLIVAVNEHQCVKDHTMKFVAAVASGIWVISFSWIEECLKQGRLLPEEPFEALDVSEVAGPKEARLTRTSNPLLRGYVIHAAPPFLSTTQKEVENVVTLLGGEIVPRPDDLLTKTGKIGLIITEAKASQDFELYEMWLETLKVVTVDLEWLSRSVAQYQKLSLRPFTLCSDESICDLGYPSQLVMDVTFPYSHALTTV